jgi:hypothetical protein
MAPSPSGFELCGFKFPPIFNFNISFNFSFPFDFQFPPTFFFAISLKCDLSDPLDVDFGFGGGRVGSRDLNADPEFD